jgi:hypothetical protein
MMLRRIFGHKREEVAGGWRRMHKEELRNLYASPNIITVIKSRGMRRAGHVACTGVMRYAYKMLIGKHEGKRPFGRPRRRWEDKIMMDLTEIWRDGMDWIRLANG